MRYSIYNSLIDLPSGNGLLYNSYSDKFIILKERMKEIVSSGILPDEGIKREKDLLDMMYVNGFLVDPETDEVQKVTDLINETDNRNDSFYLHLNPTMDCICRCWYCYEKHQRNSMMNVQTVNAVKRLCHYITHNNNELKNFHLSFFGGEPLMHFNKAASPIIHYVEECCSSKGINFSLHFTTNGILMNEEIIKKLPVSNVSFQITLDGNRVDHDKTRFLPNGKGTYDLIIRNLKLLIKRRYTIILRINYTSSNLMSIKDIINDLEDIPYEYRKYLKIDFQRVWQDKDNTSEIRNILGILIKTLRGLGFQVTTHSVRNGVRDTCYGNCRNYALINFNGDVFSCTARDFIKENRAGYLTEDGEIIWENNSKEIRMNARFKKAICHRCRIAPICGGGCSQNSIEDNKNENTCVFGYSEKDVNNIILERFEYMFMQQ